MADSREAAVWRALDRVTDPELDEPITDMGFVESVVVEGGSVSVVFRLPTYWCSPNFAFLMVQGIARELESLSWVTERRVELQDHMYADEVNAAVNGGRGFDEAFAALCDGADLAEVRETFEIKAFQRRQEAVLLRLRALGYSNGAIAGMTLRQLEAIDFGDGEAAVQRPRYRALLVSRGLALWPGDLAFRDHSGAALVAEDLGAHLATLRGVRINMEFNGVLCRGLKSTRYKEVAAIDGEPTLVDFIQGRVPPRAEAS